MNRSARMFIGAAAAAGVIGISLLLHLGGRQTGAPAAEAPPMPPAPLPLPSLVADRPSPRIRSEDRDGVQVARRPYAEARPTRRENPPDGDAPPASAGPLRPRLRTVPHTSAERTPAPPPPAHAPSTAGARALAPFGRALKCELVFTLESINERTPIVALVAEDQWWDGRLIIPAGTEAHGMARMDRLRDRILSDEDWILVLPRGPGVEHGTELRLRGIALDRDQPSGDGVTWGLTDGSSGLRGRVIRSTDSDEIRLLATTFLSGATRSLQRTSVSALGATVAEPGPRNAVAAGAGETLDLLAERILEEIRRNGSYLQVPAGKQFYLYLTQSLEIPLQP